MLSFRTAGYNGYGVQYSPYFDNKLAVSTSSNYGLVGNGRLFILNIDPSGAISNQISWETQDGLFDVAWSEIHENQVSVALGDGLIKLFDLTVGDFPIMNWKEHTREVFSVNWNLVDKSNFISASWDGSIKLWSPQRQASLLTLNSLPLNGPERIASQQVNTTQCVYNAAFSPHSPSTIISCNGSSHVQVWDIREPQPLKVDYVAHSGLEALSCTWNQYKSTIVASAGTDKSIRIWDLRMIPANSQMNIRGPTPVNELLGHEFAVRKVQWSPHDSQELLSVSYDMTARVWRDESGEGARYLKNNLGRGCKGIMGAHKEFVIGCDYSLWGEPGWVATTGWDEMVHVWDSKRI